MIKGIKIVTAEEEVRIEQCAYADGLSEEAFMQNAGRTVAVAVENYVVGKRLPRRVVILAGKGNNGGDGYCAALALREKGFTVSVVTPFRSEERGALCRCFADRFLAAGGEVVEKISFPSGGILVDALVGTGFRGKAEGVLARLIDGANRTALPILAVDIPSGLDGNSGLVGSVAIRAAITVCLGLAKKGLFTPSGWEHTGQLQVVDFGLPQKYIDLAQPVAYLFDEAEGPSLLPVLRRCRHKYEAGYVIGVAGSSGMAGSAMLSALATLRSGAGIIRLFHPIGIEEQLSASAFEVVKEGWDLSDPERILEECGRARALFIGPGMGRRKEVEKGIGQLLGKVPVPTVIDADALYFLAEHPKTALPQCSLLTPHSRELERLLGGVKDVQAYVESKGVTLLLKGAPTWIFHPTVLPVVIARGDPGMATAGTGDILTGLLAGLLAQGMQVQAAAALGAYLHGMAGELAAAEKSSYGMIASDLLAQIPAVFNQLMKRSIPS